MADNIFVTPDDLSSRNLKKTVNKAENALKKAMAAFDEGNERHSWAWGGNTYYLFNSNATDLLGSAEGKLREAKNKLDKLAKILDSGPDAMKEIDRRYKSEMKEWRKKGDRSKILWVAGGGATSGEMVITKEKTADEKYRDTVKRINEKEPVGQPQDPGSWMCALASTATILRRKQIMEGREPTFTRDGVYEVNPDIAYAKKYYAPDGNIYTTQCESASVVENNMAQKGITSKEEYLRHVLDEHPEGVAIFTHYEGSKQHAIVITDYEIRKDGSIQFYADDPVDDRDTNTGRTEIENTWMYRVNPNTTTDFFMLWYIE